MLLLSCIVYMVDYLHNIALCRLYERDDISEKAGERIRSEEKEDRWI